MTWYKMNHFGGKLVNKLVLNWLFLIKNINIFISIKFNIVIYMYLLNWR